jgi:hypothetical protein
VTFDIDIRTSTVPACSALSGEHEFARFLPGRWRLYEQHRQSEYELIHSLVVFATPFGVPCPAYAHTALPRTARIAPERLNGSIVAPAFACLPGAVHRSVCCEGPGIAQHHF